MCFSRGSVKILTIGVFVGGPGFATNMPGLTRYNDAYYNRMGYACAIGVSIFLVILVLTIINLRYVRSATDYEVAR